MPTLPTWSGFIQISLVSIAVKIFPVQILASRFNFTRSIAKRISVSNINMWTRRGKPKKRTSSKGCIRLW